MSFYKIHAAHSLFPELESYFYNIVIGDVTDALETYGRFADVEEAVVHEITEQEYKASLRFLDLIDQSAIATGYVVSHNLYPCKVSAALLSTMDYPIRVGHPKIHNVYRRNPNGDLIFVYHGTV